MKFKTYVPNVGLIDIIELESCWQKIWGLFRISYLEYGFILFSRESLVVSAINIEQAITNSELLVILAWVLVAILQTSFLLI